MPFIDRLKGSPVESGTPFVCPIIEYIGQIDGETKFRLSGTAFYISTIGIALSATHCFVMPKNGGWDPADVIKGAHLVRALPAGNNEVHLELVHIKQIAFMKGHDIALIHAASNEPIEAQLAISNMLPKIGDEIFCYSCPNVEGKTDSLESIIHIEHQDFSGIITDYYPNGRDRVMLPGPCFQVEMEGPGGTSGGPVFNKSGNVVGVISASMGGVPPVTFFTPIVPMLDMLSDFETDQGKKSLSLRNLADLGFLTIAD